MFPDAILHKECFICSEDGRACGLTGRNDDRAKLVFYGANECGSYRGRPQGSPPHFRSTPALTMTTMAPLAARSHSMGRQWRGDAGNLGILEVALTLTHKYE